MTAVIVDCVVYRAGKRVTLPDGGKDIAAALAEADKSDEFVWIGLHDPTPEEMGRVADAFALHHLAVEDAMRAHQRPKLERYDAMLFMVLKTLWYIEPYDAVETGQISIFVGSNYVATVRLGAGVELGPARRDLETDTELLERGPYSVLYSVCDRVVDAYEEVAEFLEDDVEEIEQSVFSERRGNDAARIYRLKREVAEFRRAVVPLREPLLRFANGQVVDVPRAAEAIFRDVADHAIRVSEQIETVDGLLSSAHDALMARISVQQNNDMRKISAWVAIAAVPTMLAGIYGMNFEHMPELTWKFGYPLVLAVMATACLSLYRLFKKSGWL